MRDGPSVPSGSGSAESGEEGAADKKLTSLAEGKVNLRAAG